MRRGLVPIAVIAVLLGCGAAGTLALRAHFRKVAAVRLMSLPPPSHRVKTSFEVAEVVLDGGLGRGWQDWGWGPHDMPDAGPMRVAFEGYGGVIFHHDELPSRFGALVFRFRGPAGYGDFIDVSLRSGQLDEKTLPRVHVDSSYVLELDDGWREALVPWELLNPSSSSFDRIVIQARRLVGGDHVPIDKVVLTKPSIALATSSAPEKPVQIRVRCDKPRTKISPLIYGIGGPEWGMGATARRMGGNPLSRFNWDLGVWNTGNDWYFENVKGAVLSDWLDDAHGHQAKVALVVPMIGWIAKDSTSVGFPVSKFGSQKSTDPYRADAGNGRDPNDKPIPPGPPTQTSVSAPPELVRGWVEALRKRDVEKGRRSVDMFILDNEPSLWSTTHRDVHPEPLGYDELIDRTIQYGEAIRAADPDALVAGPAEWGWSGYFYSAKDQKNGTTLRLDRRAHGDVPLVAWYLKKLAEHETKTGHRILDVLDLHFYPQVDGIYANPGRTDPDGEKIRIRSVRALWDPSYKDESWIADTVRLIPRMKEWIAGNYPGRGISIGEWSFGGEARMSGALAIAEALGHFGQEGILSAFYWTAPAPGTPGFQAFRAYRNFDGKGAQFLPWSVPTERAGDVSLFASGDDPGTHFVIVLLNEDPSAPSNATIDMTSCGATTSRRVFAYGKGVSEFVSQGSLRETNMLHERIEPYSLKVLDVTVSK